MIPWVDENDFDIICKHDQMKWSQVPKGQLQGQQRGEACSLLHRSTQVLDEGTDKVSTCSLLDQRAWTGGPQYARLMLF